MSGRAILSLGFDVSEDIRREFSIDSDGKVTTTQRGAARLLGVTHRVLVPPLAVTLVQSLQDAGFEGESFGGSVTDVEFAVLAVYVALESPSANPQAVVIVKALTAIGARQLFQRIAGWNPTEKHQTLFVC